MYKLNEIKKLPKYFNFLMIKKNRNSIIKNASITLEKKFTNKQMFLKTDKIYRAK